MNERRGSTSRFDDAAASFVLRLLCNELQPPRYDRRLSSGVPRYRTAAVGRKLDRRQRQVLGRGGTGRLRRKPGAVEKEGWNHHSRWPSTNCRRPTDSLWRRTGKSPHPRPLSRPTFGGCPNGEEKSRPSPTTARANGRGEVEKPRTGQFSTSFPLHSPLAATRVCLPKLIAPKNMNVEMAGLLSEFHVRALPDYVYQTTKETWQVYVPDDYDGTIPYGLFTFISSGDGGAPNKTWLPVLKKYRLIFVGADKSGNKQSWCMSPHSLGSTAVFNICRQYQIDPAQIRARAIPAAAGPPAGRPCPLPTCLPGRNSTWGPTATKRRRCPAENPWPRRFMSPRRSFSTRPGSPGVRVHYCRQKHRCATKCGALRGK